jgi:nitroimidazol reductase NimA-like FMN-containing flavoprotein (pyridoxamine 5'-phosphate oxidase superfamily)
MKKNIITKTPDIEYIINKCDVCNLAMVDENNRPYVLPFNFGYIDNILYFHGTKTGKKIEVLKHNSNVCISFSTDHLLSFQSESIACSFTMKFRSVVAYGKAVFIEDYDKKVFALDLIMKKYTNKHYDFAIPAVNNINVFKVEIDSWLGRESGYYTNS